MLQKNRACVFVRRDAHANARAAKINTRERQHVITTRKSRIEPCSFRFLNLKDLLIKKEHEPRGDLVYEEVPKAYFRGCVVSNTYFNQILFDIN